MIESQPRWLSFQKGKVDYIAIPKDNFDAAVTPDRRLSGELAQKGIALEVTPSLDVTYTAFNHDLELFKNKKLRQAMSMAYDVNESNKLFYNNTALPAQSIVPPGIAGNIKGFVGPYRGLISSKRKSSLLKPDIPKGKGFLSSLTIARTRLSLVRLESISKSKWHRLGLLLRSSQIHGQSFRRKSPSARFRCTESRGGLITQTLRTSFS